MKKQTSSGKTFLAVLVVFFLAFVTPLHGVFASTTNEYYEDTATKQHFSYDGTVYEFTLLYDVNFPNLPKDEQKVAIPEGIHVSNYTSDDEPDCVKDLIQSQNYSMEAIQIIADLVVEKQISNLSEIIQQLNLGEDVGIVDLIIATNNYYSNPINFLYEGDKYMELNNFIDILEYNQEKGISDFIVRYENKVPVEPPVTTGTTQTEVTTTWTQLQTTSETFLSTVATTKATTRTPVTTIATTKATTTTPVTTIATTKATTTTPVTTVTTEATTTTSVTTTTPVTSSTTTQTEPTKPVTQPVPSIPVDPDGWEMDEEQYNGFVETAELFGIENYKIVWSEEQIMYSIVLPSEDFTMIYDYYGWWGFQICPISDLEKLEIELIQKTGIYQGEYTDIIWRPIVDDDPPEYCQYDIRCNAFISQATGYNPWQYDNWCLIPLDEDGNEVLKFLYPVLE